MSRRTTPPPYRITVWARSHPLSVIYFTACLLGWSLVLWVIR